MKRVQLSASVASLALAIASSAFANPAFVAEFDPGAGFTAADEAQIQAALNFYQTNITSNFTVTIAFGAQGGGGGSSQSFIDTVDYNAYYNALVAASSGDATDTLAITSLGGGPHITNPVTGSSSVTMTSTLAALLGVGSQASSTFAGCGSLVAAACIQIGTNVLTGGAGGTPQASLFGTTEHEVDEVLGTSSALPNGGGPLPSDPSAADLFRYSAPGIRSFALNASTDVPCTGSPTAYLSVDGGVANLNPYNNCDNGGDYGDWAFTDGLQVQDAFGPDDVASSLNLGSPEVSLLDAVGYNFGSTVAAVPESTSAALLAFGLAAMIPVRRKPHR